LIHGVFTQRGLDRAGATQKKRKEGKQKGGERRGAGVLKWGGFV